MNRKRRLRLGTPSHVFSTEPSTCQLHYQPYPLQISKLTGFLSRLYLEFRREVVWRLEAQTVGNLFNAEVSRGQQFFCPLKSEVLLIEGRRDACELLKEFTEIAVAHTELLSNLLYGKVILQRLSDSQSCKVYHIHAVVVLAKLYATLQGIHQPNEMVDDARQYLLRVWSLFLRPLVCFLIQSDDICAESHMVYGLERREETCTDPVINILSLETNPLALPATVGKRMVGVPFARKEQEQVACLERDVGYMV